MKNRAAFARGGAGIDAVVLRDAPVGAPGPGEALVRLAAATLNFRDLLLIDGITSGTTKQPDYVPLSCAAGEVVAVGAEVGRVAPGDRVSPTFCQHAPPDGFSDRTLGGTVDGVARRYGLFPAESLCRLPDAIGDMEAATLPCAGLTAWSALFGARPVRAGEWVLVPGTGGVAMAALQWAKAAGARVLATSSSDAKLARAAALGADLTVNYRTSRDWAATARDRLGDARIAVAVDVAGGGVLAAVAGLMAGDGMIAAIGRLDGAFGWDQSAIPVVPVTVGTRDQHEAMLAFAAAHAIRPVVDIVYDLERLPEAMRRLASGGFFGKIGVNLL